VKTLIGSFRYPRKGPGMMWEAAAEKMQAQGGRLLMDRSLKSLSYDKTNQLWTVSVQRGDGSQPDVRSDSSRDRQKNRATDQDERERN